MSHWVTCIDIPYYLRITQLLPDSESSLNNLGAAYYLSGEVERASQIWQQSLEINPTPITYSNIGSSLFFLEKFEQAAQMYRQAIAQTPDDYEVWGMLGDAERFYSSDTALFKPSYLRAVELVGERLKINSTDAFALALLGHYQAAIGNRELALKYIARGQQAGPENMYVFYPSATALVILGQMEDALQSLERAVELGYPRQLVAMDAGFRDLSQMPEFQTLVKATNKKINE